MRPREITLSTVAVGSDSDIKLLTMLADIGEGRYYFTERSSEIPRIASKEANILTRNATVEGDVGVLMGEPSPIMRSIAPETAERSRATWAPPASACGDSARHRSRRPTTGSLAVQPRPRGCLDQSDTRGHWSDAWLDSAEAPRVWSQAVRWSMPEPQRAELKVSAAVDGPWVTLRAESVRDDGTFADLQDTRATVVTPAGDAVEARLPQRAHGHLRAAHRSARPGRLPRPLRAIRKRQIRAR